MVVKQQLQNLTLEVEDVNLGVAVVNPEPDESQMVEIASALKLLGFELIDSEKDKLIEHIKNIIIQEVHYSDLAANNFNFSSLLAAKLNKDYAYLSRLFSEHEDTTIEKYIIQQKVEKVKELLQYGELNLNEIAFQMGYSSSAHLSAQFKSITGITPSQFKATETKGRKPIDKL
ncbi:AraC family transcriptional regulator [Mucilaginibacter sp.]|uniref:helix-turn-helix domain-containing protein n=1 Tax=Mucilaginibacter sp. TaxID=1882438 RepID=UPI0025EFF6D2|nr:AraC family transcriptional regulator [Mucilaginibacter sp.]